MLWFAGLGGMCKNVLWFAGLGGMCKMCCGLQGWVECVKCAVVCRAGWNV